MSLIEQDYLRQEAFTLLFSAMNNDVTWEAVNILLRDFSREEQDNIINNFNQLLSRFSGKRNGWS